MASRDKIISFESLKDFRDPDIQDFLFDPQRRIARLGTFDLAHPGYIEGLEWSRDLGTVQFVGVWPDAAVRQWKGMDRPYQTARARMQVLAGMEAVDYVFEVPIDRPIGEFTRYVGASAVMNQLRPAVFVVGQETSVDPGEFKAGGGWTVEVVQDATIVNKVHSTTEIGARVNGHRMDVLPGAIAPGAMLPVHTQPQIPGLV
jgi:bifunctional ADP-heptose synthase (sugar kinase/adenylyltransferase)